MISLIKLLKELKLTQHYSKRKKQRGDISKVSIPKEAYGNYNPEEANSKIIGNLKSELFDRLSRVEGLDIEASFKYFVGYKIFKPILVKDNKEYPMTMYAYYEEDNIKKENSGNLYYGIVHNNAFITLILSSDIDDIDLEKQTINHLSRKGLGIRVNREPKILSTFDYTYKLDIDELFGNKVSTKETPTEDSVEYEVKTDYRKGGKFIHQKHGIGTVVNTSTGTSGKGDTNGKLDWVDVDFNKPYLKGGVFTSIRRISPVFTKVYFDTHAKKQS
jgi:hypothetical protein